MSAESNVDPRFEGPDMALRIDLHPPSSAPLALLVTNCPETYRVHQALLEQLAGSPTVAGTPACPVPLSPREWRALEDLLLDGQVRTELASRPGGWGDAGPDGRPLALGAEQAARRLFWAALETKRMMGGSILSSLPPGHPSRAAEQGPSVPQDRPGGYGADSRGGQVPQKQGGGAQAGAQHPPLAPPGQLRGRPRPV